jgi:leader peptidase (prepilin peptidase) / N-methyltransferase
VHLATHWYVLIGILGLTFGSFFNVAIYRWPLEDKKEREWVKTPSRCPKCSTPIRWYDNIPLFSWLVLLRGKCRACQAPISWRYPLVELGTALLWLLTAWLVDHQGFTGVDPAAQTGWHVFFALWFASLYLLTVIIDFETQLIPDEITIAHFIGSLTFMALCAGATISGGWVPSLIGMVALAAFYFVFCLMGAMGFGDVLLAVGIGLLFGWPLVVAQGFLSLLLGGIPAIFLMAWLVARRKYKFGTTMIAFGPYIGVAAYVCLFWGWQIVHWYLSIFIEPGKMPAWLPSSIAG